MDPAGVSSEQSISTAPSLVQEQDVSPHFMRATSCMSVARMGTPRGLVSSNDTSKGSIFALLSGEPTLPPFRFARAANARSVFSLSISAMTRSIWSAVDAAESDLAMISAALISAVTEHIISCHSDSDPTDEAPRLPPAAASWSLLTIESNLSTTAPDLSDPSAPSTPMVMVESSIRGKSIAGISRTFLAPGVETKTSLQGSTAFPGASMRRRIPSAPSIAFSLKSRQMADRWFRNFCWLRTLTRPPPVVPTKPAYSRKLVLIRPMP